jgi:hypothetical protein
MVDVTLNVEPKVVEPTIFDLSSPGRTGVDFPDPDVPRAELPKDLLRTELPLPELAEVDVVRHYIRLSKFNYSVDDGFYPLGSYGEVQPQDQRRHLSPAGPCSPTRCSPLRPSRATWR